MADNQQIGVIYSPWVEEAEPLAKTLVDALSRDHKPWVCSVLELDANADMAKRCSTFVTIGGDGTILRTVRLAAPSGIPIVGVNRGRVGFMAELTAEEAAQRVGKSRAAVTNALRLLNLSEDIQAHLRQGRLSVGHAKVILGLDEAAQQTLAAERVIEHSFSVRETEELVAGLQAGPAPKGKTKSPPSPAPQRELHVTALENRLTETLGTKVALKYRAGKGTLNIKFFSDDDLERILNLLGVESE